MTALTQALPVRRIPKQIHIPAVRSDVIDHGSIHSIYAHDPKGIPIEFSHNVEGIDIRKNPQMKDRALSEVALGGAEPGTDSWPHVERPTPTSERFVYPGAGSEYFHGKKTP